MTSLDTPHAFSLQFSLNYIDYELYPPTPLDQQRNAFDSNDAHFQSVPVIRIFGRTDAGQHVCALIHGAYPYMFIEYKGKLDSHSINLNCLKLHESINVTLATTYRRNPHDDTSTFVADITVCKATPFYGMHAGWRYYFKISLLSPKHMTRLADLLRQGSIFGGPCQPYESQLPYLIQFMIDYNLYGCAPVRCAHVAFRHPLPEPLSNTFSSLGNTGQSQHTLHGSETLHTGNIPKQHQLDPEHFPRQSHTTLEVDIATSQILNRLVLKQRILHKNLQAEHWTGGTTLPSLQELWHEEAARRESMGMSFDMRGYISTESRARSTFWTNEDDLKKRYEQVLQADQSQHPDLPDSDTIPTSFEAIEVFAQRQALLVSLNKGTLPHTGLSQDRIASIRKIDEERQLFMSSQRSGPPPTPGRAQFQSATMTDLARTIQPSSVARHFLVQRLRGGGRFNYHPPPSPADLAQNSLQHLSSAFPAPHYGDPADFPAITKDFHGVTPRSDHPAHISSFLPRTGQARCKSWSYSKSAPTTAQLKDTWRPVKRRLQQASQVMAPTQHLTGTPATSVSQADVPLSVLSIEMHAQSRGGLLPNPTNDPVLAIYWAFEDLGLGGPIRQGCLLSTQELPMHAAARGIQVLESELDLLNALVELVRELDPDIVMSFEMQNSSVGYLHERAHLAFSFDLCEELGRFVPSEKTRQVFHDRWGETTATSVKIAGRHVLNLWRVMRGEMNLLQYTLENVCFHLLKRRLPKYEVPKLQIWLSSDSVACQQRVYRYYTQRTRLNLEICQVQGLLSRVSEQARLLGIDFYSVFSRGSQFKVESLMFRIAKPECYMLLSPSRKQVAQQNALECLPLVMEPQSHFYHDPVVVLDFTSLYPSIVIAYNYCYSTCLGKLGYGGVEPKLGVTYYNAEGVMRQALGDDVEIAPNGVVYAKASTRKSLLAKMLTDLLETRAMVKQGMKLTKDKRLLKLMHNRQLALKLIANVTYGYTSASFSGRMPCSDIADSIVQTGRESLEMAIEHIYAHPDWNAEVVYGDTDSLFIKLPGRTKEEAYALGQAMAKDITRLSPSPVSLKFEKVYLPCILLAKKRYVGFKYESPTDEPVFEAKGIETVRRDGTPAEQKIEEKALRILFTTGDISQVKRYFQEECWKIMTGKCSLHDFCFAKEVKLGHYSTKGVPPPGAVISARSIARDPRSEPQYGERVPYLVISGPARSRLTDRCVAPEELLNNPDLRLDVDYYITKNIVPPLERLFSIMGVQVRSWYDEMPRSKIERGKQTGMLAQFLSSSHCPVCRQDQNRPGICATCLAKPDSTQFDLTMAARESERVHRDFLTICASCCRQPVYAEVACVSKDCPVYYKRIRSEPAVDLEVLLHSQV
ncbi:hypothetical protein BCR37DRAFT_384406 [Protomyces lactucae-debilis]|uniref:DNA polymerase n=1 Tax=Protomyces lactucae-debilis TaxID=2754530 RepID=A0A1Y2ESN8_PROLT|nr:uncharacterized protein BCR37DRAFT_384406 [Protomyces lactucae-debilis]ORY74589.1 hypothetical protein BCR37DRAFT_384406 [Protomyces lactucae-debilis]